MEEEAQEVVRIGTPGHALQLLIAQPFCEGATLPLASVHHAAWSQSLLLLNTGSTAVSTDNMYMSDVSMSRTQMTAPQSTHVDYICCNCMQATLMGLWLVPAIISVYFHFWRFVGVWAIFSGVTGYILYTCTLKRIEKTTPRRVGFSVYVHVYHMVVLSQLNALQNSGSPPEAGKRPVWRDA